MVRDAFQWRLTHLPFSLSTGCSLKLWHILSSLFSFFSWSICTINSNSICTEHIIEVTRCVLDLCLLSLTFHFSASASVPSECDHLKLSLWYLSNGRLCRPNHYYGTVTYYRPLDWSQPECDTRHSNRALNSFANGRNGVHSSVAASRAIAPTYRTTKDSPGARRG